MPAVRAAVAPAFIVSLLPCGWAAVARASYVAVDLYNATLQKPPAGTVEVVPGNQPQQLADGQLGGSGYVSPPGSVTTSHAFLWTSDGTIVDLNPTDLPGFDNRVDGSSILATDGVQQVGSGNIGPNEHALLWHGAANTSVDLSPTNLSGFTNSRALGSGGDQQVGYGSGSATTVNGQPHQHALLWNSSASSAVDLHSGKFPALTDSQAVATDGTSQVGFGFNQYSTSSVNHALLWHGSADSATDLNPVNLAGFTSSIASSVSGDQQVGAGSGPATTVNGNVFGHALLWHSSANSAVDLNPTNLAGIYASAASFTNGKQQVGYGGGSGTMVDGHLTLHALLWSGTAGSAVDLSTLLPPGFFNAEAGSIDASGDIFGLAYDAKGNTHVFEWIPVPEPTVVPAICLLAIAFRRTRRFR